MAIPIKILAAAIAAASSSSSSSSGHSTSVNISDIKYDVFLSFRGIDTRNNFICHLNDELPRKNIETYMDDHLERGDNISSSLFKAIEESKLCLIIFSENYASSYWCLDELVHILECKKRSDKVVIPIFYGVEPTSVRRQSGSFETALAKLEKRFKEKMPCWRAALRETADLSGWDSRDFRPDNKLIVEIVKDVMKKLSLMSYCHDIEDPVRADEHFKRIKSLVRILKNAVLILINLEI